MTTERDGDGERCPVCMGSCKSNHCAQAVISHSTASRVNFCDFEKPCPVHDEPPQQQAEPRAEPAGVPEGTECPALFVPNTYNGKHRFELHLGGAHRLCVFCNMSEQTAKWVAESLAAATARAEAAEGALAAERERSETAKREFRQQVADAVDQQTEAAIERFIAELQNAGIDVRHADADIESPDPAQQAATAVIAWWERVTFAATPVPCDHTGNCAHAPAAPAGIVPVSALAELVAKWRNGGVSSPIGPLHGAGINDGFRWAADDLEALLPASGDAHAASTTETGDGDD